VGNGDYGSGVEVSKRCVRRCPAEIETWSENRPEPTGGLCVYPEGHPREHKATLSWPVSERLYLVKGTDSMVRGTSAKEETVWWETKKSD
jgi:hypothetical protein